MFFSITFWLLTVHQLMVFIKCDSLNRCWILYSLFLKSSTNISFLVYLPQKYISHKTILSRFCLQNLEGKSKKCYHLSTYLSIYLPTFPSIYLSIWGFGLAVNHESWIIMNTYITVSLLFTSWNSNYIVAVIINLFMF